MDGWVGRTCRNSFKRVLAHPFLRGSRYGGASLGISMEKNIATFIIFNVVIFIIFIGLSIETVMFDNPPAFGISKRFIKTVLSLSPIIIPVATPILIILVTIQWFRTKNKKLVET